MITPDEQQADLTKLAYDATSEDLGGDTFKNLSGVDTLGGEEPPLLQENTQVADNALSDPNQNPSSFQGA